MDENLEVPTEYCSNCKRDIPAANFVMHVNHCQRNLTLCQICNEPVPTSQRQEHYEEYHAKVKCPKCGISMEKMSLDEHKEKECMNRIVTCEYCELELTCSDMISHKEYCGSRTELCEKCNKYIKQKDMETHFITDCGNTTTVGENNNTRNRNNLPNGHGRRNPPEMLRNFGDVEDFGVGVEALQSMLATGLGTLPLSGPFRDMGNRDTNIAARGPYTNDYHRGEYQRLADDDYDDIGNDVDDQIENDQLMAAMLASRLQHMEDNMQIDGAFGGFREPLPSITPSQEEDTIAPGLNGTALPCEFCDGLFPAADLIQHQSGCQMMSDQVTSSSRFPNMRSVPRSLPPVPRDSNIQSERKDPDNDLHIDIDGDADDTFLPCEFCQELFPTDNLIMHQSICDPQRSRPPSAFPSTLNNADPTDSRDVISISDPGPIFPNRSRPKRSSRPARPSRPVVSDDREDMMASNLKSRREVTGTEDNNTSNGVHRARRPETNDEIGASVNAFGFEYDDIGLNNSSPYAGIVNKETSTQDKNLFGALSTGNIEALPKNTKASRSNKVELTKKRTFGHEKNPSRPKLGKASSEKTFSSAASKVENQDRRRQRGGEPRDFPRSAFLLENEGGFRGSGAAKISKSRGRPQSDPMSKPTASATHVRTSGLARNGTKAETKGLYTNGATSQDPLRRARSREGSPKATSIGQPESLVTRSIISDVTRPGQSSVTRPGQSSVTRPGQSSVTRPDQSRTTSGNKKSSRKKIV